MKNGARKPYASAMKPARIAPTVAPAGFARLCSPNAFTRTFGEYAVRDQRAVHRLVHDLAEARADRIAISTPSDGASPVATENAPHTAAPAMASGMRSRAVGEVATPAR